MMAFKERPVPKAIQSLLDTLRERIETHEHREIGELRAQVQAVRTEIIELRQAIQALRRPEG